jgi:hypothetical protein
VHAAQSAGREDPDAGERGQVGRRGHRGGTAPTARGEDREVADARLGELLLRDAVHAGVVEADPGYTVEHRDRRRGHTAIAQDRLELACRIQIPGAWQAMGDDRRLESDDGTVFGERSGDVVREVHGGHIASHASGCRNAFQ